MALDSFLALMTAAPRCCTVCGRKREKRRGRAYNGGFRFGPKREAGGERSPR